LSVDGYARPPRPLEKLAARGVRFDHCFSQAPWTKPSVSAILTSCYPTVTGMHQLFGQLDNRFVTLPESLRDAGWYTVGFSANPLMGRLSNYTQGFRRFFDAGSIIPNVYGIHSTSGSARLRMTSCPLPRVLASGPTSRSSIGPELRAGAIRA
jgi:arylsulfatase A-like enzyme